MSLINAGIDAFSISLICTSFGISPSTLRISSGVMPSAFQSRSFRFSSSSGLRFSSGVPLRSRLASSSSDISGINVSTHFCSISSSIGVYFSSASATNGDRKSTSIRVRTVDRSDSPNFRNP